MAGGVVIIMGNGSGDDGGVGAWGEANYSCVCASASVSVGEVEGYGGRSGAWPGEDVGWASYGGSGIDAVADLPYCVVSVYAGMSGDEAADAA